MSREAELQQAEYIGLLKSMFEFLLTSGMDVNAIRAIVDRALAESGGTSNRGRKRRDFGLSTAGRVLDAWHRSRRYTDKNAEPRAIPLLGKAPSVEALIKSENLRSDSAKFARQLRSLGLVIRSGRNCYKPTARIAVVAGLNPLIQEYVARSSANLLGTIRHNVSKPARSRRLIERFAEVPDLPSGSEAAFRRFSHEQGWAMLKTMNDWLESRRTRKKSANRRRKVRAGVHLYAYVDPA